jgi:hypothetical protein
MLNKELSSFLDSNSLKKTKDLFSHEKFENLESYISFLNEAEKELFERISYHGSANEFTECGIIYLIKGLLELDTKKKEKSQKIHKNFDLLCQQANQINENVLDGVEVKTQFNDESSVDNLPGLEIYIKQKQFFIFHNQLSELKTEEIFQLHEKNHEHIANLILEVSTSGEPNVKMEQMISEKLEIMKTDLQKPLTQALRSIKSSYEINIADKLNSVTILTVENPDLRKILLKIYNELIAQFPYIYQIIDLATQGIHFMAQGKNDKDRILKIVADSKTSYTREIFLEAGACSGICQGNTIFIGFNTEHIFKNYEKENNKKENYENDMNYKEEENINKKTEVKEENTKYINEQKSTILHESIHLVYSEIELNLKLKIYKLTFDQDFYDTFDQDLEKLIDKQKDKEKAKKLREIFYYNHRGNTFSELLARSYEYIFYEKGEGELMNNFPTLYRKVKLFQKKCKEHYKDLLNENSKFMIRNISKFNSLCKSNHDLKEGLEELPSLNWKQINLLNKLDEIQKFNISIDYDSNLKIMMRFKDNYYLKEVHDIIKFYYQKKNLNNDKSIMIGSDSVSDVFSFIEDCLKNENCHLLKKLLEDFTG